MNCVEEIRRAQKRTLKDLGEAIGASESTVSRYQRDDTRLTLPLMRKLARALGVTVGDIADDSPDLHMGVTPDHPGEIPPAASYVSVRSIAASPAMGDGTFADDAADIEGQLSYFPEDLIRHGLHRRPEELRAMDVVGPSMAPVLESGDQVLVDITDRNPSQPGIFVVWDGSGLVAKWVERVAHADPPRLRILSENSRFAAYEVVEDEAHVAGRVVWYARRL